MSVRVLVIGASGQVGVDLVDTLLARAVPGFEPAWQPDGRPVVPGEFDVLAPTHHDLDLTDAAALTRAITMSRPDVIVNLAAYTAVDQAESDEEACFALNRDAVVTLSNVASVAGSHLITVSTDYVFDGTKGSAYVETDSPHPLNVYGRSKFEGELGCSPSDTIVRTSWVVGVRARNVIHVVAERAARGEVSRFVTDQTGTLTASADLARALVALVRDGAGGVWHFANEGTTTWYDVACDVAEVVSGRRDLVAAITSDELDPIPPARRPRRSDLATVRWHERGWSDPPPWRDALGRLLRDR